MRPKSTAKLILTVWLILLAATSLFVGNKVYARRHETTQEQTERLTPELWKILGQFNLREGSVKLAVRREADMEGCKCWGRGRNTENGDYYIEIQAMEDMPAAMPWAYRREFQNKILQHEVMHIVLTQDDVPSSFQDKLIHTLQPSLREP